MPSSIGHERDPRDNSSSTKEVRRDRCCSWNGSEIEGFPNTYLQAWARGTPVVAFLDPEYLIASNGMGRAITSVAQMCEEIVTLSGDRSAWETASQRSREYMDNRFNVTRMTAPYTEALSNLYERAAPVRAG